MVFPLPLTGKALKFLFCFLFNFVFALSVFLFFVQIFVSFLNKINWIILLILYYRISDDDFKLLWGIHPTLYHRIGTPEYAGVAKVQGQFFLSYEASVLINVSKIKSAWNYCYELTHWIKSVRRLMKSKYNR